MTGKTYINGVHKGSLQAGGRVNYQCKLIKYELNLILRFFFSVSHMDFYETKCMKNVLCIRLITLHVG